MTISVTNTNDDGPGSLRQALTTANNGDTIDFAVTGTITLTSGGLAINKNITISGPGADQLSIDGNQALLVFGVFPGSATTISGLTTRNAQFGVVNERTLAVINCVPTTNSYDGLFNQGGVVAVSSCVITENLYDGLYSYDGETTVSNSVVNGNAGGGLFNYVHSGPNNPIAGLGSMTVSDTIISDNGGPGVWNYSFLTIFRCTLSDNSAGEALDGGGIRSGT